MNYQQSVFSLTVSLSGLGRRRWRSQKKNASEYTVLVGQTISREWEAALQEPVPPGWVPSILLGCSAYPIPLWALTSLGTKWMSWKPDSNGAQTPQLQLLSLSSRPFQGMHAKLLQLCPTFYDPMDHSPPGSSVHGILQARILDWVAVPSSSGTSWLRDQICNSYVSCIGRGVLYH